MHSYHFKAVKNYKNIFQLIHATKIKHFNSYLYFYYVDNGINPLTVAVDPSKMPPIIAKK